MKSYLRKLVQYFRIIWRLTPARFRTRFWRLRVALRDNQKILMSPTYADDGFTSQHVVDFLKDERFLQAYAMGRSTGALDSHPGDIHFRAYIACWAAKYASALEGDFVECGVGKGLLSRAVVSYLDFAKLPKRFYLFDTFEGIPVDDAADSIERSNMSFLNDAHFSSNYYERVKTTFREYSNVILVKGRIPQSFHNIDLGIVSYISIDMNNAVAEIAAIEYLWDKLVVGGIVVLDDYAYGPEFINQKAAWDRFAVINRFEILTLPTGQGLIIKNKT